MQGASVTKESITSTDTRKDSLNQKDNIPADETVEITKGKSPQSRQWNEIKNGQKGGIGLMFPYATTNNFVKTKLYDCSRCFLRPDVAAAVQKAHSQLQKKKYGGLRLFDCYRPSPVQQRMWSIKPDERYVANPRKGSDHNRGIAVDLTIVDQSGKPLDMGTPFDDFSPKSHHTYRELPKSVRENRLLLKKTMASVGLQHVDTEWWHYAAKGKKPSVENWVWPCGKSVSNQEPSPIATTPSLADEGCKPSNKDKEAVLAKKIVDYMRSKKYDTSTKTGEYNIVYIEGACEDGTPNADEFDYYNDRRIIIEFINGKPSLTNHWLATTEPGNYSTTHSINAKGVARIAFGQYKNAWQVGMYSDASKNRLEGLVQVRNVKIKRDTNRDGKRTRDIEEIGIFGINQQQGTGSIDKRIGQDSAGELVGWLPTEHKEFMEIIKKDSRYLKDANYLFTTTIINGDEFGLRMVSE
jgi:zinc D-Ala-D-Ala dipeptidase